MRRITLPLPAIAGLMLVAACAPDDKPGTALTAPPATIDSAFVATSTPGQPLPGLSSRELAQFTSGLAVFATPFTDQSGLGPLFNSNSCAACHDDPVLGGYGDSAEVHVAAYAVGQSCNTLDPNGGPVVQQHATPLLEALGYPREPTPVGATGTGIRTTPVIFGLGMLDAVGDRTIKFLAKIRYPEGVHGRAAILPSGRVGRFGRKASVASLTEFNAGAFFNEMGVTNSFNPFEGTLAGAPFQPGLDPAPEPELSAANLAAADAFVRFLAPVAPLPATPETRLGEKLFAQIRCTSCHVPALLTDPNRVRALSLRRIRAYSDLLLHDMGPAEADICNGVAKPEEFRTQPLMGMQFLDMFMHDGQSHTIPDAIQRHGGEGRAARDRFFALTSSDQAAVVAFVSGL
jgi:CxxC motif-containing protein (DUF1111 family)